MERPIIEIDEEKCDGCGQCVLDCAEGALAVVNGKARLIRDSYCDGLGACLNCPRGALRLLYFIEQKGAGSHETLVFGMEGFLLSVVWTINIPAGQPHDGVCAGAMVI